MTLGPLFEPLPAEILAAACEYLADAHPPSVLSLGLANKHWYSVTSRFLYRTIAFKVGSQKQLAQDARRCEYLLRRDSAFAHVRRFIVHTRFEAIPNPVAEGCGRYYRLEDNHSDQQPLQWQRMPCAKLVGSLYDDDQTLDNLAPHERCTSLQRQLPHPYWPDVFWKPLCRLVESLPALRDFIFACHPDQLPHCLLQTLHGHLANPRLHICVFALHSLADAELDPHEVALAGSPLLHRLWVRYDDSNGYDRRFQPNYHADAVMDLVRGVAPNLKEIRVFHDWGREVNWNGDTLPPPLPWKGFPNVVRVAQQRRLGALQFLELDVWDRCADSPGPLSKEAMLRWEESTDFTVLRALRLRQRVTREALAFLVERCRLPSLVSLALYYDDTSDPEGVQLLQAFLRALPNLRSLELMHQSSPIRQLAAADALHSALTRLWLPEGPGTSYDEDLPLIVKSCPLIEDLRVTIPRYRGGAPEVRLYRVIGRLPRLQRLELLLDASSTTPATRVFVRTEHGVPAGDDDLDATFLSWSWSLQGRPRRAVYNALVDSAVDEKLAQAIFRAVSHGKKHARSSSCSGGLTAVLPLETLYIRVPGGDRMGRSWVDPSPWGELEKVLKPYLTTVAHSWRVRRDPRDDRRGVLHAVEVDRRRNEERVFKGRYALRGGF
ncbi:hypothetical protein DL546_003255 [Coniochaeta pulveracea]|uniref:F-box domain-containing protein n=1 Tax=Coniochaeta pulveracea TaxID=177199 RepID=A0A420Y3D0_9PEZI|nr:hypothetical protein DL546_003255 [Coniochaeta pulveracea]